MTEASCLHPLVAGRPPRLAAALTYRPHGARAIRSRVDQRRHCGRQLLGSRSGRPPARRRTRPHGDGSRRLVRRALRPRRRARPDVVVTDIRMPPTGTDEGIRAAARLRESHPAIGVVVLSQFAVAVVRLGAPRGRVRPSRLPAQGSGRRRRRSRRRRREPWPLADRSSTARSSSSSSASRSQRVDSPVERLTPREREILGEMAQGKSNAAIAATLVLSANAPSRSTSTRSSPSSHLTEEPDINRRVKAVLMYLSAAGG